MSLYPLSSVCLFPVLTLQTILSVVLGELDVISGQYLSSSRITVSYTERQIGRQQGNNKRIVNCQGYIKLFLNVLDGKMKAESVGYFSDMLCILKHKGPHLENVGKTVATSQWRRPISHFFS